MSRNLNLPYFPIPPDEYSQQYFAEVLRSYSTYLQNMQNPGEGRNTFTVFTNLQTDDSGLEVGAVFEHNGQLRVPLAYSPYVRGSQATGTVGTVTVTISCVNCENAVDTPEEEASYPEGNCPNCGQNWTGSEKRSTNVQVTMPEAISGSTL